MLEAIILAVVVVFAYVAGRVEQAGISARQTEVWREQCLRADQRFVNATAQCHALTERMATMRREGFRVAHDGEDRPNEVYAMDETYDLDVMRRRREAQAAGLVDG